MNTNAEDRILVVGRGKDKNIWLFVFNSPTISLRFVNSLQVAPISTSPPVDGIDLSTNAVVPDHTDQVGQLSEAQPTRRYSRTLLSALSSFWVVTSGFLPSCQPGCVPVVRGSILWKCSCLLFLSDFPSWPPCSLPEASVALGKIRVLN